MGGAKIVPFDGVVPSDNAGSSPSDVPSSPEPESGIDGTSTNIADHTSTGSTQEVRSRRTGTRSVISRMSTMLRDFKFENPKWMFLPMSSCFCLSGLSGVLWYTQGLEEKTNPKIFADPNAAMAEIANPGTIRPCWDHFWDHTCLPQYVSSLIFFLLEVLFLVQAWIAFRRWRKFDAERQIGGSNRPKALVKIKNSSGTTATLETSASRDLGQRTWEWLLQFSPGQPYFWHRAWGSLFTEISMQVIRGFLLEDSYARTNAMQTCLQTLLIMLHVDCFAFFYYAQSEVGYVFCNLYSEIAYLIVRVYFHGPLALRATSFLDFLTLAIPLTISAFEIQEIVEFIYNSGATLREITAKERRRRGFWMILLAMFATILGCSICGFVAYLSFVQGCPEVYNSRSNEARPANFITPFAFDCFFWQFDMTLSPACACVYLVAHPVLSTDCAGFGSNEHKLIDHLKPHLTSLRFFSLGEIISESCRATEKDMELIASWTNLRSLAFNEFTWTDVPKSFENLRELTHLTISMGWLERVDTTTAASWNKLEMFSCHLCPHLDSLDFLSINTLPRLGHVEAHGVGSCPRNWLVSLDYLEENINGGVEYAASTEAASLFKCSPRLRSEKCIGMPDWLALSLLEGMREGAQNNQCSTVLCSESLDVFDNLDFNRNYMFDHSEYQHFVELRYKGTNLDNYGELADLYTIDTHNCFAALAKKLFNQYVEPKNNVDTTGYIDFLQYVSWYSRYSTCLECDFLQPVFDEQKQIYDNSLLVDENDICAGIEAAGHDPDLFEATCTMDISEIPCHQGLCGLGMDYATPSDGDKNLIMTASEVAHAGSSTGQTRVYDERFIACLQERVPVCVDADFNGEPAIRFHTFLRLAFQVMRAGNCPECVEKIDCTKCDMTSYGYEL